MKFNETLLFIFLATIVLCVQETPIQACTSASSVVTGPSPVRRGETTAATKSVDPITSNWKKLQVTKGKAAILISCEYSIYIESTPSSPACPEPGPKIELKRKDTWREKAVAYDVGNTSIKILKRETGQKVGKELQIEYGVSVLTKMIQYDISFIDCAKLTDNPKYPYDLSLCPGYAGGMQLISMDEC